VEAPSINLEQLWEEHVATEFSEKSADAAVATMVPHATVNHVPVMTGGKGTEALRWAATAAGNTFTTCGSSTSSLPPLGMTWSQCIPQL
jgi:hypothetical protein